MYDRMRRVSAARHLATAVLLGAAVLWPGCEARQTGLRDEPVAAGEKAAEGGKPSVAKPTITNDVALMCINPDCDYQTTVSRQDYYDMLDKELTFDELHGMNPPRTLCPQCHHPAKTVVQGVICPNCGRMFIVPRMLFSARRQAGMAAQPPSTNAWICPHCGTDFHQYWAQHRGTAARRPAGD